MFRRIEAKQHLSPEEIAQLSVVRNRFEEGDPRYSEAFPDPDAAQRAVVIRRLIRSGDICFDEYVNTSPISPGIHEFIRAAAVPCRPLPELFTKAIGKRVRTPTLYYGLLVELWYLYGRMTEKIARDPRKTSVFPHPAWEASAAGPNYTITLESEFRRTSERLTIQNGNFGQLEMTYVRDDFHLDAPIMYVRRDLEKVVWQRSGAVKFSHQETVHLHALSGKKGYTFTHQIPQARKTYHLTRKDVEVAQEVGNIAMWYLEDIVPSLALANRQ